MTTAYRGPTRDEIAAAGESAFRFIEEHGGRKVRAEDDILAYINGVLTFEIELDWREQCVFLLVCRTVKGGRPPGYYADGGRRMRIHLAHALTDFGGAEEKEMATRLKALQGQSGPDAMMAQIALLATTLRSSWDFLYSHSTELFPDSDT